MSKSTNLIIASILIILTAFLYSTSFATLPEDLPQISNQVILIDNGNHININNGMLIIDIYNGSTGYNKIYSLNGTVLVYEDRPRADYWKTQGQGSWTSAGIPINVTYVQTATGYNVTRNYGDSSFTPGADYSITYIFNYMEDIKVVYSLENIKTSTDFRFVEELSGVVPADTIIYKNKSISSTNFSFDISDMEIQFGNDSINVIESTSAQGRKINYYFNVGYLNIGDTLIADPKFKNNPIKTWKFAQSNNQKLSGNVTSDVVFLTQTFKSGNKIHITPTDKNNHADKVNFRIKTQTLIDEIPTISENHYIVRQIADNETVIQKYTLTIDPNSEYTDFTGGFSETVISGVSGTLTIACNNMFNGSWCNTSVPVNATGITASLTNITPQFVWNNTGFSKQKLITINGSMVTNQTNIPLQWYGTLSGAKDNGTDIRLFHPNGTQIAREIEAYNSTTGMATIFFPFNTTAGVDSEFYITWGNSVLTEPAADSTHGSQAVWDSNYVVVHHMNNLLDSTGNLHTMTAYGAPSVVNTEYGKAYDLDGSTQYFSMADSDAWDFRTGDLSFEAFIDIDVLQPMELIGFRYTVGNKAPLFRIADNTGYKITNYMHNFGTIQWGDSIITTGNNYLSEIRDTNNWMVYLNGVADNAAWATPGSIDIVATSADIGIYAGGGFLINGKYKELRISNIARSSDWLLTTHKNSNNPTATGTNSFYETFGDEEIPESNVYFTPTNHPTSEDKTTNLSTLILNGTVNTLNTLQNVQFFCTNNCTFNVTLTIPVTDDFVQTRNETVNGYAYGNATYTPPVNMTNVNLTIKKPANTWENEGTSVLTTNDINATLTSENSTQWNVSSSAVNTSITLLYNITMPINHNPTGTVSNQTFSTLQNASVIFTASDTDGVSQLSCSITLDSITINSCTSPADFGIKSAGTYTIYVNGTDNNGTLSGTGDGIPFNETAIITITQATITPYGIKDGAYAIRNNSIPSNATILKNKNNSILTNVVTLNWSTITSNTWDEFLNSVNYSYVIGTRIGIRLNFDGIYTSTDNKNLSKANITTYFPDTKIDPYESDIQWIEFNFTNTSESLADMGTFANEIAQNITEQTNNKFPIYTVQSATGLDSIYVMGVSPIQYINIMNVTAFIDDETSTLRSSTSKSRVYSGNQSDEVLSILSTYKTNIRNRLRGTISSSHPTESYAVHINNGTGGYDLILFNNQSTTQNLTVANKTGIWLDTTNDIIKNYLTNTTLEFNVSANSFGYIINENVSKLVLNNTDAHDVYGQTTTYSGTLQYNGTEATDGIAPATSYFISGDVQDVKIELYDPSYVKTPLYFIDYGWINASKVNNYSDYKHIIVSDKNPTELITINRPNDTYGYIAVSDYLDTDEWESDKKNETDWWTSRGYNIFLDGLDYSTAGVNFSTRFKNIVDHIRITKSKKAILNTYSAYQTFATYGDGIMKESAFSRWGGDVNNPTYTWEDMTLEKQRADYYTSHGIPVILMSFGEVDDYEKQIFDYLAGAVLYGYNGDNSFRYGQPNFQEQKEIRVPDLGTMLEAGYTETSDTDWNRLYSKGRVHINPVNHTYSIDDGLTVNYINIEAFLMSGGGVTADNLTLSLQNPNGSIYNLTWYDQAPTWKWRTISIPVSEYKRHGNYPVYIASRTGGYNILGYNDGSTAGLKAGLHSYFDVTSVNLHSDGNDSNYTWVTWPVGLINKNWFVRINMSYSTTQKIDTINNSYITQSQSRDTSGNTTINLTTLYEYSVNIYTKTFTIISTNLNNIYFKIFGGGWISANIPSTNTTDINATSISWTETTVGGKVFGVVIKYISPDNWLVRALLPDSQSEIMVSGNVLPVLSNVSDKNVVEGDTVYIDIDATDANSDPLSFSNNRSDLFADFSSSSGQGNWTTNGSSEGVYSVDIGVSDGIGNTNTTMTVTVIDGTVQNVQATPDTNSVNLTWDAVIGASHYNISRLQDFIYYNATGAIIDGLKDAPYNTTATKLRISTPNPVTIGSNDEFYIYYNATHLFMYLNGYDKDIKTNDNYMRVYFDTTANGLTTNDYSYKISEAGILTRYKWSGSAWITNPGSNANAYSTGAGTSNLTFEMEIPLSELSLSNNSNIKLLLERASTALVPDVRIFHPSSNINNTNNLLWLNQTLSTTLSWLEVGNTTTQTKEITGLIYNEYYTMGINSTVGIVSSDRTTVGFSTTDKPYYSVSGYVKDINNLGISNSTINISYPNGVTLMANQSNSSGYYKLNHIHNGTFNINANKTGYNFSSTQTTINGSNITINFILHTQINETVLNIESISPSSITQSASTTITSNFTSVDSTISTVTLNITNPNSQTTSHSMSCTTTTTSANCSFINTNTSIIGTYTINNYTITDINSFIKTINSSLTFEVTATPSTSSSSSTPSTSPGSHLPFSTTSTTLSTKTPDELATPFERFFTPIKNSLSKISENIAITSFVNTIPIPLNEYWKFIALLIGTSLSNLILIKPVLIKPNRILITFVIASFLTIASAFIIPTYQFFSLSTLFIVGLATGFATVPGKLTVNAISITILSFFLITIISSAILLPTDIPSLDSPSFTETKQSIKDSNFRVYPNIESTHIFSAKIITTEPVNMLEITFRNYPINTDISFITQVNVKATPALFSGTTLNYIIPSSSTPNFFTITNGIPSPLPSKIIGTDNEQPIYSVTIPNTIQYIGVSLTRTSLFTETTKSFLTPTLTSSPSLFPSASTSIFSSNIFSNFINVKS